jgi:hypothetical protein
MQRTTLDCSLHRVAVVAPEKNYAAKKKQAAPVFVSIRGPKSVQRGQPLRLRTHTTDD